MKLIGREISRCIQFVIAEELRPFKPLPEAEIAAKVFAEFGFRQVFRFGDTLPDGSNDGVKVALGSQFFRLGSITISGEAIPIMELGVHNDGIVVVAPTTEQASVVIDYVMKWAKDALGVREPSTKQMRVHISTLVVEFDHDIDSALGSFRKLAACLSRAMKDAYQISADYDLGRLSLMTDEMKQTFRFGSEFIVERRKGVYIPHSANRYFCSAPLPTQKHLQVLEELEAIFKPT